MTTWLRIFLALVAACLEAGCNSSDGLAKPVISFTNLPSFGEGRADKDEPIEGRVTGAQPGEYIVLYAKSGVWWVQPTVAHPLTPIQNGGLWKTRTHPGAAYAALLVSGRFHPRATVESLPEAGGPVLAVATKEGSGLPASPAKTLQFAGYDWRIRDTPNLAGGSWNAYSAGNAWTDSSGYLHLAIRGTPGHWTSAEVNLPRSLGYGSYRLTVRDVGHFDPSVVFTMLTWDEEAPSQQMNLELSQWGEPQSPNGQFVIQPYFVPANTVRFHAQPGRATFELTWSPGRALFKAARASHTFTSGVPVPGHDSIHLNFYVFDKVVNPLLHPSEVIIENFEYLP